jgi:hypothetical protein
MEEERGRLGTYADNSASSPKMKAKFIVIAPSSAFIVSLFIL